LSQKSQNNPLICKTGLKNLTGKTTSFNLELTLVIICYKNDQVKLKFLLNIVPNNHILKNPYCLTYSMTKLWTSKLFFLSITQFEFIVFNSHHYHYTRSNVQLSGTNRLLGAQNMHDKNHVIALLLNFSLHQQKFKFVLSISSCIKSLFMAESVV